MGQNEVELSNGVGVVRLAQVSKQVIQPTDVFDQALWGFRQGQTSGDSESIAELADVGTPAQLADSARRPMCTVIQPFGERTIDHRGQRGSTILQWSPREEIGQKVVRCCKVLRPAGSSPIEDARKGRQRIG